MGVDEAGPENDLGLEVVLTDAGGLNIIEGIRGREEAEGSRLRRDVDAEERSWEVEMDFGIRDAGGEVKDAMLAEVEERDMLRRDC